MRQASPPASRPGASCDGGDIFLECSRVSEESEAVRDKRRHRGRARRRGRVGPARGGAEGLGDPTWKKGLSLQAPVGKRGSAPHTSLPRTQKTCGVGSEVSGSYSRLECPHRGKRRLRLLSLLVSWVPYSSVFVSFVIFVVDVFPSCCLAVVPFWLRLRRARKSA